MVKNFSIKILLVFIMLLPFLQSCSKQKNESLPRKEQIKVYTVSPSSDIEILQVGLGGTAEGQIHVQSDLPVEVKGQVGNWFKLVSVDDLGGGHTVINYTADPLKGTLEERIGTLNIVNQEHWFGRILRIRQGFTKIHEYDLSGLPDGHLTLTQDFNSYTLGFVDSGIHKCNTIYICFRAYAEGTQATDVPVRLNILGGSVVDATWSDSEVLDIVKGSYFAPENLYYVMVSNKGKRLSTNTNFNLELQDPTPGVAVHINNVVVCRIDADEIPDNPDQDPEEEEE